MRIDVVVVTHQSAASLARCLDALPPDAGVVVVDNASTDAGVEMARSRGGRVIANDTNAGFASGANQGAAAGDGELILFVNPDARIESADLNLLVKALEENPGTAIVGPRLTRPDGVEQRAWWPFPSAKRSWAEAFGLLRLVPSLDRSDDGFVVGACLLVRRAAFERLGGFDERFWLYGEEADLCRRARDAGWGVRLVPEAVAEHLGGASAEDAPAIAFEHFQRGTEHFVVKHHGRAALVSHRLALLIGSLLRLPILAMARSGSGRKALSTRRRIVGRLTRVLRTRPTSVDSAHDGEPTRDVVVCSLEAWDDVWRRNQFLVRELLAADPGRRVLFVEPPLDVPHVIATRRRLTGPVGLRPVGDSGRLWALRPLKVLPRTLGPSADRILGRQVRTAVGRLGFDGPTLWVNDDRYALLPKATGWPTLYDVTDDWLLEEVEHRHRRRREGADSMLTTDADVVVVCSPALAQSRGATRDVVLIPNAVDAERFRCPLPRPADLPHGRIAVYVGTLHESRLDLALVERLASEVPDLDVVLVGPNAMSAVSTARLTVRPNMHLLGARPHDTVPAYLQHADVLIIPHLVTPFTESLDPIKAYECLATGKPTVSTPLAAFRGLGDSVRTSSPETFVADVRRVLDDPPQDRAVDEVPTWQQRGAAFSAALEQACTRPQQQAVPAPRRRVVYLDHCAQLSGGELALARLLPALEGVEAHVILAQDGPLVALLREAGVSVEILAMPEASRSLSRHLVRPGAVPLLSLWHAARYVATVRVRLRRLRPDLVHTNSLKSTLYGSVAARLAGIPVVCHVRDRVADDYMPPAAARLVRAALRFLPDLVIANSEATRATLGAHLRSGIAVVGSPVIYDPVVPNTTRHLKSARPLRVGMVGRFAPWKGQHIFLEAFARAFPQSEERAVLVGSPLFGEDDYEQELRRVVDRLGIRARVEFSGFVDDVPAKLGELDILVHASVVPEPFGQVVVEGMAMGLPVVAAAAGGPLEIITDGLDGMLFLPGDIDALAGALTQLAEDPLLRDRLGSAARVRAAAFSPERIAAEITAVYDHLLGDPLSAGTVATSVSIPDAKFQEASTR